MDQSRPRVASQYQQLQYNFQRQNTIYLNSFSQIFDECLLKLQKQIMNVDSVSNLKRLQSSNEHIAKLELETILTVAGVLVEEIKDIEITLKKYQNNINKYLAQQRQVDVAKS